MQDALESVLALNGRPKDGHANYRNGLSLNQNQAKATQFFRLDNCFFIHSRAIVGVFAALDKVPYQVVKENQVFFLFGVQLQHIP